ncbi:RNA-binding protein [Halobacteria archaeon AArc-dxtr1]|nr:RNA-binding protein [Halobacteria archaeon AArc-dxtr1]
MIGATSLALGAIVIVVFGSWLVRRGRTRSGSSERHESLERHRDAKQRDPPVEIGDEHVAGIEDFSTHHSGERHAVCKVEGFVVFVEGVPADLGIGDVVEFRVLSYNRGHTSASGTYLGRT